MARSFDIACRIAVEQSEEHFHAHVEFDEDIAINPGDRVRVHGAPVRVAFGESTVIDRMATVTRAGPLRRAWTKLSGYCEFAELYEVSFTPGSLR